MHRCDDIVAHHRVEADSDLLSLRQAFDPALQRETGALLVEIRVQHGLFGYRRDAEHLDLATGRQRGADLDQGLG